MDRSGGFDVRWRLPKYKKRNRPICESVLLTGKDLVNSSSSCKMEEARLEMTRYDGLGTLSWACLMLLLVDAGGWKR